MESSRFVGVVKGELVDGAGANVVIAYTHHLEVNSVLENGKLQLIRRIKINKGSITDISTLHSGCGAYSTWLILAIDSTKLQFRAFKSIDDDFIVDEIPLVFRRVQQHLVPGSLKEDPSHYYFTLYTKEEYLIIFRQIGTGFAKMSPHPNFKKVMETRDSKNMKLFIKPELWPSSMFLRDDCTDILTFDTCFSEEGAFGLSMIRKNQNGKYMYSNPIWREKSYESYLSNTYNGSIPEPVAPVSTILEYEGSLLFSKTSIYFRGTPYVIGVTRSDCKIPPDVEISYNEEQKFLEGDYCRFKFTKKEWDVVATENYEKGTLIVERNGELSHLSISTIGEDEANIEELKISKVEGSLPNVESLMKINSTVYLARVKDFSKILLFKISNNKMEILQELVDVDLNLIEEQVEKHDSRISPEYILKPVTRSDGKVEYVVIDTSDSKITIHQKFESNEEKNTQYYDVLDYKVIDGKPWILQKDGLIKSEQDAQLKQDLQITHGLILDRGEIVTISNGIIKTSNQEYNTSSPITVLEALNFRDITYVAIGSKDGSITIYSPTAVNKVPFSNFPVTGIRLIESKGELYILVGSAKGEIGIFNDSGCIDYFFLGDSSAFFSPAKNQRVLVKNSQNLLEIEIGENGGFTKTFLHVWKDPHLNDLGMVYTYAEGDQYGIVGYNISGHQIELVKENLIQRLEIEVENV